MPNEDDPKPPDQPQNLWGYIPWALGRLFGLNAEQRQGLLATVMVIGAMYLIWHLITDGRIAENERTALIIRAFESENEKSRQAIGDMGKLTVESQTKLAAQLSKLELRLTDMAAASQKLQERVQELTSAVGDLRKKIPPMEVWFEPLRYKAPMPRMIID